MADYNRLLEGPINLDHLTPKEMVEREVWAMNVLSANNVTPSDPELLREMLESGWGNLMRDIRVANTVCTLIFKTITGERCNINLPALATFLVPFGGQLNPPNFPALIVPLVGLIRAQLLIFSHGAVVVTGFVERIELLYVLEFVRRALHRCGYRNLTYDTTDIQISNIVATASLPERIDREKFFNLFPAAASNPDFPGLFVQFTRREGTANRKWTVLVFSGCTCNFMGCKTWNELTAMAHLIAPMLYCARRLEPEPKEED